MKRLLTLVLTGALVLGPVGAAGAGKSHALFEDAIGDAGLGGGRSIGDHPLPGFDQPGFDLVSGELTRKGANLELEVSSAAMPQTGSLPEGAAFLWHFVVDGESFRLMIKSQDVGEPLPTTQQGMERVGRVDIEGHFRLETCGLHSQVAGIVDLNGCDAVAYEDGFFDPAAKSFGVTIPLKDIGASTGSVIQDDESIDWGCAVCWVTHVAENDVATVFSFDSVDSFGDYRVPRR
jgi:hypothetical protein